MNFHDFSYQLFSLTKFSTTHERTVMSDNSEKPFEDWTCSKVVEWLRNTDVPDDVCHTFEEELVGGVAFHRID